MDEDAEIIGEKVSGGAYPGCAMFRISNGSDCDDDERAQRAEENQSVDEAPALCNIQVGSSVAVRAHETSSLVLRL